ncbi:MAG: ubiquinone biosynthesis protein COQ4 [Myxococcota bacterium]|jgi:ubiquinone biosynthesis protein COQ4
MTRWQILTRIRTSMADPALIGDVPALKSELGGTRARPEIEAQMDDVRGYHPPVDLDALIAQPAGTFGHEYARFLSENKLTPITMTGNLDPELVARNAFVVRYGIIHDMVHVLTGFDTSWPGEIGVWAFVGAQNYSTAFRITGLVALLVAPLRCPLRLGEAWRCFQRGRMLARRAPLLLTLRLEEHLHRDLADVREELSLSEVGSGYLPAAV